MLINKKIVLAVGAGLVLGASSCKKFMDVNTNPNVAQTVTVQTLLPAAQLYLGSAVGVDLQVYGSIWSQYWTQTSAGSQYVTFEQYSPTQDQFANSWTLLYQGAENFYQLYNVADSQHKKQYKAISLLMQAYTFQVITDGWGDAPYKQALLGQYATGHLIAPKYDSQSVVYKGIIAKIDSANSLISVADGVVPGADDLIYGGNMSKWQKFSNTLKLKVLLRMAYINPAGAQLMINTFFTTNPQFIGEGDDAKIAYGSSSGNKNPLYAEESSFKLAGIQNLAGSKTIIDTLNSNADTRRDVFFERTSAGSVVGLTQGTYNMPQTPGSYSIPSTYVAGDVNNAASANAPVNLLMSWESFFMQAEVAARGWGGIAANDNTLFYAGIKASFDYYSNIIGANAYNLYITNGANWSVYPVGGTVAQKMRSIITQKWFAMCGNQGFEAWTEWRRTGYPDFLVTPINSVIGLQRPERFLYPTAESAGNANFPKTGVAPVTAKVWWDVL
jgi:hypothetical protein